MKKSIRIIGVLFVIACFITAGILILKLKAEKEEEILPDYSEYKPQEAVEKTQDETVDYLAAARAVNPDIVAWIKIKDTQIDYPIVQGEDNAFYLNHDFEKKETRIGTPFLDYRCEKDFTGFNSVIYGHNFKDKSMFSGVNSFKDKSFFDEHTEAVFITSEKIYTLHIFACINLPSTDFIYQTVFLTDTEKEDFVKAIKDKAKYYREPGIEDYKVIVLSTCSYEFKNARTVIVGYLE